MRHERLAAQLAEFNKPVVEDGYATHIDAWANALTGVGTDRDKVVATGFSVESALPFSLLEQLYHNDDVSARVCDLLPETALREGFTLPDQGLTNDMYALGVMDHFEQAWIFGRLYGGAAVIVGMPGASITPGTGDVSSLLVVDRMALYPNSFYLDVTSPKYGQPETYRISRPTFFGAMGNINTSVVAGEIIHETRVIRFPGARTSPRRHIANGYWDDSVLQRVYQVVQAYGITWASVVHLLQDAAQGVYKMKDLWNMIVGGNKDAVEARMRMVDETRAVSRAILVDAENEDFNRVATPFSGIPELIDRISERLASATGYPLTVLMGSSPAGMNATGQSDLEIFYGRVQQKRCRVLTPAIQQLAKLMGPKKPVKVTYPPLWMPSGKEISETRYATAQADNLYYTMGALLPEEIRKSRFGTGEWSAETEVDLSKTTHVPVPAAPAAGTPEGGKVAESPGAFIGSHHFSAKYGR